MLVSTHRPLRVLDQDLQASHARNTRPAAAWRGQLFQECDLARASDSRVRNMLDAAALIGYKNSRPCIRKDVSRPRSPRKIGTRRAPFSWRRRR